MTGDTGSTDFPITPGAFDPSFNGGFYDGYVAKVNPTGSALIYATFLGGSGSYDVGYSIAVDATGNAYVTGSTDSPSFPITPGIFDPTHNGNDDVFVTKLNATGSALVYSSYLGGSGNEYGLAIAVDETSRVYVTGTTDSSDFPTTPGAFDPTHNGYGDAFVTKLNATGSALVYSTFLGGSDSDSGHALAVDATGSAFVVGATLSSDFPVTSGAFDPSFSGGIDGFVMKLGPTGGGAIYATFLGGGGPDGLSSIAVDGTGNAYVSGGTNSSNFPATPDAFDASYNGGGDAIVVKLDSTGSGQDYGTFLGGSGGDAGVIAVDEVGSAYVTGRTESSDFPTTPDAFDPSFSGGYYGDAFVAKLRIGLYTPEVLALIEQPQAGALVSGAVTLRGFAIDLGSTTGTGIDMVHIYLDGPHGTGTIIGAAIYGVNRPDIAAQYGARFGPSGWELAWHTAGLAPGVHRLYLYAHRTTDNAWSLMDSRLVIVAGGPTRWLPIVLRRQ